MLISSPNAVFLKYFPYLCGVRAAKRQTDNNRQFKEIIQIMATLVLQIPDESLVSKVKQACKMIVGVASVQLQKPAKEKCRLYDPETGEYLNDKTMKVIEDALKGKNVTSYASADDMFKALGIEV